MSFLLRPIEQTDNSQVAHIIRTVMTEYGAVGDGYSIQDPEVDHMFEAYQDPRAIYLVLVSDGQVRGCGGIAPLKGGDADTCELKKMYFLPEVRGKGQGRAIMEQLEQEAAKRGFTTVYLETIAQMEEANKLYKKAGYQTLSGNMGNTGHSACGLFYAKRIYH
jgi:putative acetyltransferase